VPGGVLLTHQELSGGCYKGYFRIIQLPSIYQLFYILPLGILNCGTRLPTHITILINVHTQHCIDARPFSGGVSWPRT